MREQHAARKKVVMKKVIYRILAAVSIVAAVGHISCSRKAMETSERRDSVRVEHRIEYVEKVRDTTIYVSLPVEVREVVRRDSSFLETSIAASFARIEADGSLFHSLSNKERQLEARAQVKDIEKSEQRDSVRIEYVREVETVVKTRKPALFWCCFFFCVAAAGWGIYKLVRRFSLWG